MRDRRLVAAGTVVVCAGLCLSVVSCATVVRKPQNADGGKRAADRYVLCFWIDGKGHVQLATKEQHTPRWRVGQDDLRKAMRNVGDMYRAQARQAKEKGLEPVQPPTVMLAIDDKAPIDRVVQVLEQLHYEGLTRVDVGVPVADKPRSGTLRVSMGEGADRLRSVLDTLEQGKGDAVVEVQLQRGKKATWGDLKSSLKTIAAAGVDHVSMCYRVFTLMDTTINESDMHAPTPDPAAALKQLQQTSSEQLKALWARHTQMRQHRDVWFKRAKVADEMGRDADAVLGRLEMKLRQRVIAGASTKLDADDIFARYELAQVIEADMLTMYREYLAARIKETQPEFQYIEAYETSSIHRPTRPTIDPKALTAEDAESLKGERRLAFDKEAAKVWNAMRLIDQRSSRLIDYMATDTKRKNVGVMIDPDNEDMAMLEYRGPELMPDEVNANASESTIWNLSALPCRRLDAVPGNPDWLYVDTWHIVGPLEGDRRRQDLNIRYGPESAINLGELYIGEKGSTIAWDWVCNGRLHPSDGKPRQASWRIEPTPVSTYAIYYAFTEIYSPDERDVWVATGADDYGKLWINDKLQWTSPIDRKPYTALENVQKVTLKKGHNKVLVRLENAGGATAFSLMISTKAPD